PIAATKAFFDSDLTARMRQSARSVLEDRARRVQRDFTNAVFEGISFSSTPLKTRGMCLRADLDGFTAAVECAFKNKKVLELVRQFTDIMQYPSEFSEKLDRNRIELPWAGDCCTILIQPRFGETVEEMRASLPIEAGVCWHGLAYENGDSK